MLARSTEGQHVRDLSAGGHVDQTLVKSAFEELGSRPPAGTYGAAGSAGS